VLYAYLELRERRGVHAIIVHQMRIMKGGKGSLRNTVLRKKQCNYPHHNKPRLPVVVVVTASARDRRGGENVHQKRTIKGKKKLNELWEKRKGVDMRIQERRTHTKIRDRKQKQW
jgi:hypothetical protein